jgi:hypothetical protein
VKIYQIKNQFVKLVDRYNYNKEQKFLNKYVNIHGYLGNSNNKIFEARKGLANYAQAEGVTIDIFAKGSQETEEVLAQNASKNPMENKVLVVVKNMLTGKASEKTVDVDINKTYKNSEITPNCKSEYEDNFLRNLYRNIAKMANNCLAKTK